MKYYCCAQIGVFVLEIFCFKANKSILIFFLKKQYLQITPKTATTRHGVTRKDAQKRLQDTENLFRKNIQLKDVC